MRKLTRIIIHTTATKPEWMESHPLHLKVKEIRRWHMEERRWSDIGYHYVIGRSGLIEEGRPLERAGAHVKGHNADSIGVALIGGFGGSADDKFADHYTGAQEAALIRLIDDLQDDFGPLTVHGHNEFSAKACPCFRVKPWWAGIKASREHKSPGPFWVVELFARLIGMVFRK